MTDPLMRPAGSATLARLLEQVRRGVRPLTLGGVSGTAAALFLYLIGRETGQRIVVLCPDDPGADRLASDLRSFAAMVPGEGTEPIPVFLFPPLGGDPYQGLAPHPSNGWERVEFLRRLRRTEAPAFFLLAGTSLLQPLPPPEVLESSTLRVAEWQEISPERFQEGLVASGYAREDLVTQRGEWSRRGGILDVFPASGPHPLRIELFGNQVESLRTFDPATQRSLSRLASAEIPPIRELPLTRECMARLIPVLEEADPHTGRFGIESRAEALRERGYFLGVEALAGLAFPVKGSLFDYLAPGDLLAVAEPGSVEGSLETAWADLTRRYREDAAPALPPPERLYLAPETTRTRFQDRDLELEELPEPEAAHLIPIQVRSRPAAGMPGLLRRIREDLREGWWQVLALETAGRLRRMEEILAEEGLPTGAVVGAGGGIFLRLGTLREGFELPEPRLVVYTEAGIFGEARRVAPAPRAGAAFHPDFRDLRPGDLLVHAEHGIGRFLGLERITAESRDGDEFLVLEYLDRDRLYLPIFRLDLVQRYSGSGGTVPRLDRLGGRTWERTQARVRRAMREMAEELLRLYAARKAEPGLAFSRDTPWQQELEDAFPFEATPDQARAIGEVKQDMERPTPMDRLLCGDVGFGKTEVALRSTFKAVMDGRQVAVLVPTTVLAYQHFRTFRDRFAPFPVRVDLLSRFRTPAGQKRTLSDLAEGKLEVVIGTHRILSGDVRFRNLGLLIIDEEQRFGVRHKERIQAMRRQVDVLTMTATPIPRTLQMSLAGIRDLSVIETPPRDRLEIQTTVVPFREGVLSAAIRAELARGGQIYFVHNRVESIGSMARLLLRICPEARVEIAHGQMREAALERTMLAFMEGKFDVLLSTTIIENGLDIPNVNTLIVNRADRFGLAQLYQLRGRVGRSRQRAYAYLLVPSFRVLTAQARQRLRVLQEFTRLGSGFRIAAMDLEIRGAGNILGAQQHGHIAAVGFDTYVGLLEAAVHELRGEEVRPEARTELNLRVDYALPEDYLPDPHQRLFLYKRISSARTGAEIEEIRRELEDGFGRIPPAGLILFELARLRVLAASVPVQALEWSANSLRFRFGDLPAEARARLIGKISLRPDWRLNPQGILAIPAPVAGMERIRRAESALKDLL